MANKVFCILFFMLAFVQGMNAQGSNVDNGTLAAAKISKSTTGALKGDLDGNGLRTTTDVMILIDYVLGRATPNEELFELADMDDNGTLSVADVMLLVNVILNGDYLLYVDGGDTGITFGGGADAGNEAR